MTRLDICNASRFKCGKWHAGALFVALTICSLRLVKALRVGKPRELERAGGRTQRHRAPFWRALGECDLLAWGGITRTYITKASALSR